MAVLDVLVLGGGLAGSLLARQLRLHQPDRSVGLVEPRVQPRRKVGESMVELGADYLNRRLGLSGLLYREHLPKQGLRFFFDTADRSLPVHRLSEIGIPGFAVHPSFQVDRARLDATLLQDNIARGVADWRGWRVEGVRIGTPHEVVVEREGHRSTIRARWVVDATGRRRLLGRQLGLVRPAPEHAMSAAWCRVEDVAELEAQGNDAWRARWLHSCRDLATCHWMQDRSWTWLIPLRSGLSSIGVVCEPHLWHRGLGTRDGLLGHFRQTISLRQLLERARVVDIGTGRALASGTTRYVSARRWAVVGEAAGFTDPLFSPGTDHIAWHNDLVSDLIRRDFSEPDLRPHAHRIDALLQHQWRLSMGSAVGQYAHLASYDLRRLRYVYDVFNYFNGLSAWLRDDHLRPAWQTAVLEQAPVAERSHNEIGRLFTALADQLRRDGRLFEGNADAWDEGLFDWNLQRSLPRRSPRQEVRLARRLFAGVRKHLTRALQDGWRKPPGTGWLAQLYTQLRLEADLKPG